VVELQQFPLQPLPLRLQLRLLSLYCSLLLPRLPLPPAPLLLLFLLLRSLSSVLALQQTQLRRHFEARSKQVCFKLLKQWFFLGEFLL
jgi:hypothetical protein